MDHQLAAELLAMRASDLRLRDELARDGSLFDGYHPRMEELHKRNAARLRQIIAQHGWPGRSLVGEAAAEAAWMIVQHSIGEPQFMRSALELFRRQTVLSEIEPRLVAMTEDRIRMFEGRPQLYATNGNWDEHGNLSLGGVEDPEHLDERRAAVDLPPFRDSGPSPDPPPKNPEEFHRRYLEWTRRAGWRK